MSMVKRDRRRQQRHAESCKGDILVFDKCRWLGAIADDSNGTPTTILEGYSYLGLGSVVERLHPQTTVNLTYVRQGTDPLANGDGGDQYTGLDRFGRVIDQNWTKSGGGAVARYQYGYDRDGNALYRKDLVAADA